MSDTAVIEIESDLLNLFRARDRKNVWLPPGWRFPLRFENYLTWTEPTGVYQFLVFRKHGNQELAAMAFKRNDLGQHTGITQMCGWCHAFGPSDQIDMLTISVNARTTVGVVLCVDLSCVEKLETTRKFTKKSIKQLTNEVVERMTLFYERKFELDK